MKNLPNVQNEITKLKINQTAIKLAIEKFVINKRLKK